MRLSTGPIENDVPNKSQQAQVAIVNNNTVNATVRVKVFSLDGLNVLIFDSGNLILFPDSSIESLVSEIEGVSGWEIQCSSNKGKVFFDVFGQDANQRFNVNHRIVHAEMNIT